MVPHSPQFPGGPPPEPPPTDAELFQRALTDGRQDNCRTLLACARAEHTGGVAFLVPTYRGVLTHTLQCLWAGRDALGRFLGEPIGLLTTHGSATAVSRMKCAVAAVRARLKFGIWVDSDQTFDANALIRLFDAARRRYGDSHDVAHADAEHSLFQLAGVYPLRWHEPRLSPIFPADMRSSSAGEPPLPLIQGAAAQNLTVEVDSSGMGFCVTPGVTLAFAGEGCFADPMSDRIGEDVIDKNAR
jgi:hypothetical protein